MSYCLKRPHRSPESSFFLHFDRFCSAFHSQPLSFQATDSGEEVTVCDGTLYAGVCLRTRVGERRDHGNHTGSGELSEMIVVCPLWTAVQNWTEMKHLQCKAWWSCCLSTVAWLRLRDMKCVSLSAKKEKKTKLTSIPALNYFQHNVRLHVVIKSII